MKKEKKEDTNNISKKILEKAIELCGITRTDRLIYGDSFVEFGERSIKVLKPTNIDESSWISKNALKKLKKQRVKKGNKGKIILVSSEKTNPNKVYGKSFLKELNKKRKNNVL